MVAMAFDWLRRGMGDVISGESGGVMMAALRSGIVGVVGALRGGGGGGNPATKDGDWW